MTGQHPELPEPTEEEVPDGTQIPTDDDLEDEEGDAGVGEAELNPLVFSDSDEVELEDD